MAASINSSPTRPGETRAQCDPFYELDDRFYALLDGENGGFEAAADEYARRNGA